jgi:hypothetical protein
MCTEVALKETNLVGYGATKMNDYVSMIFDFYLFRYLSRSQCNCDMFLPLVKYIIVLLYLFEWSINSSHQIILFSFPARVVEDVGNSRSLSHYMICNAFVTVLTR